MSRTNHAKSKMTGANIVTLNYGMLKSTHKTTLNPDAQIKELRFELTGNMNKRAGFMVNTDFEYMAGLNYIIGKNIGIRTHYDSDMGFGAGLTLNY